MEQIFEFLMNNPILILFVVLGILGNIGSSTANKKRQRERQQRQRTAPRQDRPQQDRPQQDRPRPQASGAPQQREEDDLSRRIREMLEGRRPEPERPVEPPARTVVRTPPPAPAEPEEAMLAQGFDIAFESERDDERDAERRRRVRVQVPAPSYDAAHYSYDVDGDSADTTEFDIGAADFQLADDIAAGVFASGSGLGSSLVDVLDPFVAPRGLPKGVTPRSAFAMLVALGPCRGNRSYDHEQRYLLEGL